jgi:hypothetical protein
MEDGRQVFGFPAIETDASALYFGCQIATRTDMGSEIVDGLTNAPIRFGDLFYKIEAMKSGRHHPDGCLWIQTGRHALHANKVSILDILQTQLEMLGVPIHNGVFKGNSLLPLMV